MNRIVFAILIWAAGLVVPACAQEPDGHRLLTLFENQQYREAAVYLHEFYPDTTTNTAVLSRLGYCYRMAGDLSRAEYYYLRLLKLDDKSVSTLMSLGAINAQRGVSLQAIDYYRQVISVDTTHARAYQALSRLFSQRGMSDSAYYCLERANFLEPANSDIAFSFARMCMDTERYHKADSVLDIALQSDPGNAILLLSHAQVAEKLKNHQHVVQLCEQLLALGEEGAQTRTLLATAYFHLEDYAASRETFLSVSDDLTEINYYYLAMACKALKRYDEALRYMDKVLELAISPNTAFYYGRKADLHDLVNQPSAAAASYLKSFQFETIPIHYYSLAVLYDRKLTNPRSALRYYRLYLKQQLSEDERVYRDYVQKRITELEK
jgi:Tetratricopeptide repeat.